VRDALARLGYAVFLPTWSETVKWTDRTVITARPLFPGYLFVLLGEGVDIHHARCTRGVIQMLPNSFNPEPIADAEIENVRLVVASKLHATACPFVLGERVTVESGALAGVSGVIVRTRGTLRVVVSIEILQRSVSVELDADTVVKAAA